MKNKIHHVHGNIRILITKLFAEMFIKIIFLLFKVFYPKVDKKNNQILISRATYTPWKDKKRFINIYKKIYNLTLLDIPRLYTLFYLSEQIKNFEGNILDVGCMKGGVGLLISHINKRGKVYLFDTFEGFLDKEDLHKNNIFKYDNLGEIRKLIKTYKLSNTLVYKKKFPEDINKLKIRKVKLCHIDVNTYLSTKKSFEYVKNKIVKGGYIIFDDYGIHGVEKVTKLINDLYIKETKNFHFIFNYFGQCILIKK
jgi:SAM-dependent methyltransferase